MKNHFYFTEVELKIQELLTKEVPEYIAKKIVTGDFNLLPTPGSEEFESFFPCVLINTAKIDMHYDNKALDTTTQDINLEIYYIYPYDGIFQNTVVNSKEASKAISNVLYKYRTLDNLEVKKMDNEVGFVCIDSELQNISFDNEIKQFFLNLEIPLSVTSINYTARLKTLREV